MYQQAHQPANLPRVTPVSTAELFCGRNLSEEQLSALSRDLLPLYVHAFMHDEQALADRAAEFLTDLRAHLASADRITIFSLHSFKALVCGELRFTPEGTIYHLEGVLVDPALQGQGLGFRLVRDELLATKAELLAFHTQSRIMVKLGARLSELDSHLAARCAPYIAHHHLSGGIDEKRYGGKPLYGNLDRLEQVGIPGLDVAQGDALFAVGRVRKHLLAESV